MIRHLPVLLLIMTLALPATAGDAPSVLVKTETPMRGEMPRIVTAYGATAPAPGASTTISVQYDGQVADVAVATGQTVHTGDPLMRVLASAAALSAYDQAQTALRLAQTELAHVTQMRQQQLATRDQVAQAEKAVSDALTQVDTLRRQGVDASSPPLQAPFDGVVSAVAVGQGDRIQANAPLLTLVRSDGIILTAGIEPAERQAVKPGDPVRMTTMSDGGRTFQGKVAAVAGQVDPKSRLVPVRIARTDGQALIDNQDLRADIIVGRSGGWKLPRSALLTDDKGPYVFQVAGGKAVRADVRILVDAGDAMLVDGPIQADRKLVTDGAYQLSDGMAVREQDAAQ
ncbi:MAG: efflux RND transporter periplasmic adaptor subunit [Rhodopila sp.]|nr:efflux RND transporter periplasmic adaptor subunit [Rhodopila sp.]